MVFLARHNDVPSRKCPPGAMVSCRFFLFDSLSNLYCLKPLCLFLGVKASLCLICRLRGQPYTWQKHAEHNGDQIAGKSPKVRWRPNLCNLCEFYCYIGAQFCCHWQTEAK